MSVWRGPGRDGGDGGLCAARCGSTARAGRRGGLLTVWPGLGQHGPGARRSPRRVPLWAVAPAGRGHDVSRPGAAGPLILIPRGRGPCAGAIPGRPDGRPGNRAEFPGGGLHGGRPGGQDGHGPQDPRTAKTAGPAAPRPGRPTRAAPWTTASGGRRQGGRRGGRVRPVPAGHLVRLARAAVSGPPPGLDLCWPGEDSGTVGRSLVSAGLGATSGIGSGPRLSSGFAGWPPVRGKS